MKKTDVDFMLTLANLMSKLEQGESCAEQLQEIAKMSDENTRCTFLLYTSVEVSI